MGSVFTAQHGGQGQQHLIQAILGCTDWTLLYGSIAFWFIAYKGISEKKNKYCIGMFKLFCYKKIKLDEYINIIN